MNSVFFIVTLILFAVVVLLIFNLLKIFVLNKLNISKWVVLALAIISFIASFFIGQTNTITTLLSSGVAVIFMLWFIDIMQYGQKKEKKIKIKPKAKPNRIKNSTKNNLKNKD